MPIWHDSKKGWCFRTVVKAPTGTVRPYGRPGHPGPYHDLPRSMAGAKAAEQRAIQRAMNGPKGDPPSASLAKKEEPAKTIRQHAEKFVDTYKPGSKPGEKREKRRVLKSDLLPYFGDMTIEGLKQTDVDTFAQREIDRGMKIKTVNNRLAVLSTLIKYVTGEKSRLRFKLDGMTGELHAVASVDVERLLDAADDERYRVVLLLAYEAGLRSGEIRGLQHTDLKAGQITVRRALDKQTNEIIAPKHNKTRTVPLSPRLVAAMEKLPLRGLWVIAEADGSFVTYDDMRETVNAIYERAKVTRPPKPLHCIRHSHGTVMARRVPLPVLQTLMGHADVKTTLRYIDVGEDDKRDAIALVFGVRGTEWHGDSEDRADKPVAT